MRVADFTRVVAGPYATMLLGDLGADVVKVERPGTGDDCRGWGPPFKDGESTYFLAVNRNKRSVELDLKSEEGRRLARELVASSDVVVESFRPGTMRRLGLDYETVRELRPDVVYCSISGFGTDGPYRERAGYDVMVAAHGGLMSITGTPGGEPVRTGVALVDVTTGLFAAQGILAALLHRQRTGEGQHVEVSLLSAQLAALINAASAYLVAGHVTGPQGSGHDSIVPYQAFRARDGYVVVGAANDRLFRLLAETIGCPELAGDPRFRTNADRVAHRDELVALLQDRLSTEDATYWEDVLWRAGVAVARVRTLDEVFDDQEVAASGQVVTVDHPRLGAVPLVGPAVRLSRTPAAVTLPPPLLGEHTTEVLAELKLGTNRAR
ncbi:formyl-CoA transferase [Prauserella sp. PE36]|uniref:CoA transferase n=2 Tax=Pseudonocardiaceae TaxID=2070 RepID=A0ABY2S5Z8_9PSEU|nr:formyl-CoA transferase [Prauserella sp. PE36]TKG70646.1 CoA transferase [Prauserella endophytica]